MSNRMAKNKRKIKNAKLSVAMKRSHAERKRTTAKSIVPLNGTKTELAFLGDMFKREAFWNYSRTKKLVDLLKDGRTITKCASYLATTPGSVKSIINELRKAAKQGFVLEDYFRKDRPLRYGKKIVAK